LTAYYEFKKNDILIIGIDFDGTCCLHAYPNIGKSIGAESVLKSLIENGHNLILYTLRHDCPETGIDYLTQAVNWFEEKDIPLYAIQRDPEQDNWTSSSKLAAQLYIDDANLGIPLKWDFKISKKPFVDWVAVRELLIKQRIIKPEISNI